MVNNPYAWKRIWWKQKQKPNAVFSILNMIVPDLETVSTKKKNNNLLILFTYIHVRDDAHGLMHTSLTATAIDDEKWNRQQQQYYAAANEDSHRLKKCRWNTFTLKLRLTTLRCSIFVFMNDFWCVRVLLLLMICLLFVSKRRSFTEYQVCVEEIVPLC